MLSNILFNEGCCFSYIARLKFYKDVAPSFNALVITALVIHKAENTENFLFSSSSLTQEKRGIWVKDLEEP